MSCKTALVPRRSLLFVLLAIVGCTTPDANTASGEAELRFESPTMHAAHAVEPIAVDAVIDEAWASASPVTFRSDWAGRDTPTSTTVRALWSESALYLLWELDGAAVRTDTTRPVEVERENLYQEDCVEMFLAPKPEERQRYFEIELGPRGHFFDLLVDRRNRTSDTRWSSEAEIKTSVDLERHHVIIEVALRAPDLVAALHSGALLPMNLYRLEGAAPRSYLAWSPTRTERPNFHVPQAFGSLALE